MDVTLINAPVTLRNEHARLSPPLGLAYIASALLDDGFGVSAIDFNVSGLNLRRVDSVLANDRPAVVGISATTETFPNALAIAGRIKEREPGTVVVLGGAHPTIRPEEALAETDVDFVVAGPGERAMVELCRALVRGEGAAGDIAGLGFRVQDGTPHVNPRAELPHPDELPLPARELFPLEFYKDTWNVLTATGSCPYRCSFCSASSLWQGRRRMRSPGSIVAELEHLVTAHGVDRVFFTDDIFTLNRRWVGELLDALRAMERPVRWGCATRVDLVDAELVSAMAEAGCTGIQFGVESGSQEVLDSVKGIEKAQALEAVRASVTAGIDAVCSFMIPFPQDTHATLAESLAFMREVRAAGARIFLSYTCPYPGTLFFEDAEKLGVRILSDRWDEFDAKHVVMETANLSAEEIRETAEAMAAELGMHRSDMPTISGTHRLP
ncbi:MAG: radical SAM protein [Anaerosomatales bacterium]|nr:radical SAM protein [Anaerosomatales bacterium]